MKEIECWWCGETISELPCIQCGNEKLTPPRPDWDRIEATFGGPVPSCGMTDAARLGGSDDEEQSTGTVYLYLG